MAGCGIAAGSGEWEGVGDFSTSYAEAENPILHGLSCADVISVVRLGYAKKVINLQAIIISMN